MNKKIFLLTPLLLVIVVVALYLANNPKEVRACNKIKDEQGRNDCLIGYAKEENNIKVCEEFESSIQSVCKREIYIKQNDVEGCNALKELSELDSMICLGGIAKTTQDTEICDAIELQAAKDSCIYNVAIESKQANLCEDIVDPTKKDFCYIKEAQVNDDPKLCENVVNEREIKMCFSEYELINKKEVNCEDLSEKYKELCEE